MISKAKILAKAKELNPDLVITQLTIAEQKENENTGDCSVDIVAKNNTTYNDGKVGFTYKIKTTAPTVDIELTGTPVNIDLKNGTTAEVKIDNFDKLEGVSLVKGDEAIAKGALATDTITITAIKIGTTTLKVKATNATKEADIVVNVTNTTPAKFEIKTDKVTATAKVGETDVVKITNIGELTNVKVVSKAVATATVAIATDTITITGVAEGTTTIEITADNMTVKKDIAVTITVPSK